MKLASDEQDFQTWKERANLSVKNEEEKKKRKDKRWKRKGDVLKKGNGCVQISPTALLPAYPEMGDAETGTFR